MYTIRWARAPSASRSSRGLETSSPPPGRYHRAQQPGVGVGLDRVEGVDLLASRRKGAPVTVQVGLGLALVKDVEGGLGLPGRLLQLGA